MQENWFYDQVQVTFWTKTIKTRLKNMKFQITEISVCKKLHFEKVFIFYFIFSCGEKNHHFKVEDLLERACVYACARVCGGYATKIPLDAFLCFIGAVVTAVTLTSECVSSSLWWRQKRADALKAKWKTHNMKRGVRFTEGSGRAASKHTLKHHLVTRIKNTMIRK